MPAPKGNTNAKGKRSEQFREQARIRALGNSAHKGKVHSQETKLKISQSRKGLTAKENNPNWKGGTSGTERHALMSTAEYRQWRDSVFYRDNFTCQVCYQYSGLLHADHIQSWKQFPELRFVINNGRTLCRACHYYVTFKRKMPSNSKWGLVTALDRKRG